MQTKPVWTVDEKTHKICRLGDHALHMTKTRMNYGPGDSRNGYVWIAYTVVGGTASDRRIVNGKREGLAILMTTATRMD